MKRHATAVDKLDEKHGTWILYILSKMQSEYFARHGTGQTVITAPMVTVSFKHFSYRSPFSS